MFCQAKRQFRLDRKLSKLNSNHFGADVLSASWTPAPWLVKSNTIQSSGGCSRLNRTLAPLCTANLGNRRLSFIVSISVAHCTVIRSQLLTHYTFLQFDGYASYQLSTKYKVDNEQKRPFEGIRAVSVCIDIAGMPLRRCADRASSRHNGNSTKIALHYDRSA